MEALARCHCPNFEIAAFMGCGEKTLRRHFQKQLTIWRDAGKANLRAKQFKIAMDDKHRSQGLMLIWLGKQLLGQKEKSEIDNQLSAHFTVINKLDGSKVLLQTRVVDKLEVKND